MLRLSLHQLRRRPLHYLWLALCVFFAVTVAVSTAAVSASLVHSAHQMVQRGYQETDLVVDLAPTDRTVAEEVSETVATLPGIADSAFDQTGAASLAVGGALHETVPVTTIADGPQQWRDVVDGRLPVTPGEVATTDRDVPLGSQHVLRPGERGNPVTVTVVGHMSASEEEKFDRSAVWLTSPETMLEWFTERVTGEYRLAAEPGAAPGELVQRLEEQLLPIEHANTSVGTATQRVTALVDSYLEAHGMWFLSLGLFLLAVAAGAASLLFSCWLLILHRRSAELRSLRAIGATSGQHRLGLVLEATMVAVPAWVLGSLAGLGVARLLAGELGSDIPLTEIRLDPVAHLIIGAAVVTICTAAALSAYRRIHRRITDYSSGGQPVGRAGQLIVLLAGVVAVVLGSLSTRVPPGTDPLTAAVMAILATVALMTGVVLISAAMTPALWQAIARILPDHVPVWLRVGIGSVAGHRRAAMLLAAVLAGGLTLTSLVLHAQQPVREALSTQSGATPARPATDAVITGAADTLSPQLVDEVRALPGVEAVATPPVVAVTGSQVGSDTALAVSPGEAAAVAPGSVVGEAHAGPDELILGEMSPLRSELVNGSVTTVDVLGQPYDVTVIFGDGPRNLIDVSVAREARNAVATQRGVPVDLAPDLPTPHALVRLEQDVRHDTDDAALAELRGVLAGHNQQVSLDVRVPATSGAGPSAWLVAVVPGLLVLTTTFGIAANLVAYLAGVRGRGSAAAGNPDPVPGGWLIAGTVELVAVALPAVVVGVLAGAGIAGQVTEILLPASTAGLGDVSPWFLAGITLASVGVVVACGVVLWLRGLRDSGAHAAASE